jgi:hypothetical protein
MEEPLPASDMERPCQALPGLTGFVFQAGFPPQEGSRPFSLGSGREVFPPEPPVAIMVWPERRADVKGAPPFGAAKRILDGEHRSGIDCASTGGFGGNTFPLVSLERVLFWTAGPRTAQEHTRRLITLIFAGRNRMVMIRRELHRTRRAGWGRSPFRIKLRRVLLFVGPCAVFGSAVQ